jgi:hypothetical protein
LYRKYRLVLATLLTASFSSFTSFAQQQALVTDAVPEPESPFRPVERNTFSTVWELCITHIFSLHN